MNKYELAVVLSAKLEDEERAAALEKVQGYITRFGGTVTNVDDWGKKRLAYEIQKMKEAFYYFIQFESENSDCPNEVEAHIRIMEPVIRYLCVKQAAPEEIRTATRDRPPILSILLHLTEQASLQKSISARECGCWYPGGFRRAAIPTEKVSVFIPQK